MSRRPLVVALSLAGIFAALVWSAVWLVSVGAPASGIFVIDKGDSASVVASKLRDAGFIRNERLFLASLKSTGLDDRLQPGRHDLTGVHTIKEIALRLVGKGAGVEAVVLIREGENLRDVRAALLENGLNAADLYMVTGEPARLSDSNAPPFPSSWLDEFAFLKGLPLGVSLEGYLFPDTYHFENDASPEQVVRRMLMNTDAKLTDEVRSKIAASGRTVHETLTMASILEREVRGSADRRLVADLFWRRLEKGMPLQADSTVNYATAGNRPAVTAADLKTDSPWNTYAQRGLPPGPIGNPGMDAILAATAPEPNDYWYFLTDADGTVHYAKDYAGHLENKRTYLR